MRGSDSYSENETTEIMLKTLVLGDIATGAKDLIRAWTYTGFGVPRTTTIGCDFDLKSINWSNDTIVKLQLWAIAGQERFGNLTRVYYRNADIAFILCDLTQPATFEAVLKWKNDLTSKIDDPNLTIVLILNYAGKYPVGLLDNAKMDQFIKDNSIDAWFTANPERGKSSDGEPLTFAIESYLKKTQASKDLPENLNLVSPAPISSAPKVSMVQSLVNGVTGLFSLAERNQARPSLLKQLILCPTTTIMTTMRLTRVLKMLMLKKLGRRGNQRLR